MADVQATNKMDESDHDPNEYFGTGPIPFAPAAGREFEPWHRPRKHFVREKQWLYEIEKLVRDGKIHDGVIRYLTLPGDDLLDIRYIHDNICLIHNLQLRYLGFNTRLNSQISEQTEINTTQFSVKHLQFIHQESEVLPDNIRNTGDKRSSAWMTVSQSATFHAINIDLCDGIAGDSPESFPNYHHALDWILKIQSNAPHDFVLLITTRVDDDSVNQASRAELESNLASVICDCQEFGNRLITELAIVGIKSPDSILSKISPETRILVGVIEWVILRAIDNDLKAKLSGVMSYRVAKDSIHDDLVSVAIRFSPRPQLIPDRSGISRIADDSVAKGDICEHSVHVPRRIRKCVHVDEVLEGDKVLYDHCVEETAKLLLSCGYDDSKYRKWVLEQGEVSPRWPAPK